MSIVNWKTFFILSNAGGSFRKTVAWNWAWGKPLVLASLLYLLDTRGYSVPASWLRLQTDSWKLDSAMWMQFQMVTLAFTVKYQPNSLRYSSILHSARYPLKASAALISFYFRLFVICFSHWQGGHCRLDSSNQLPWQRPFRAAGLFLLRRRVAGSRLLPAKCVHVNATHSYGSVNENASSMPCFHTS